MLRLLTNTIKDRNTLCLVIYSRFYIRGSIRSKQGGSNKRARFVSAVLDTAIADPLVKIMLYLKIALRV